MVLRRALWALLALLACLCTGFGPPVLTDGDIPRRVLSAHQLRTMHQVPPPEPAAAAAILVNPTTGQILYARNDRERRAPASLTKVLTAVVALQRGRLDQPVTVTHADLDTFSGAGLAAGEEHNLQQMLHVLLIPSDNVAANVIARTLAGDADTYVAWMNELAAAWGLVDTRFANPHGLDDEAAHTTAFDMAIAGRNAMLGPTFAAIVRPYEVRAANRVLRSTNELLNTYPGAVGVKTGTTEAAGECLIAWVERPTGSALTVVLGSPHRYLDTRLLLDYFYATYAEVRVDLPDSPQNRYVDDAGAWRRFGLREPSALLVSPWEAAGATFYRRIDDLRAEVAAGDPIGALEVYLAGRLVAEVPLYAR